jgi:hypothetical protein
LIAQEKEEEISKALWEINGSKNKKGGRRRGLP